MNPRNVLNYFRLSIVFFEFLQFAAVVFHPLVRWSEEAREQDKWLATILTRVLPGFLLVGSGHIHIHMMQQPDAQPQ